MAYKSGIELPQVAFSTVSYSTIPIGSYFTGFDLDNDGKLSKMDSNGVITVIEGLACDPIDIVYADLYDAIVNGNLLPGAKYRLLDYKSVNFLHGGDAAEQNRGAIGPDPTFNAREIYTGPEEILLLEAISEYDLSPIAYSETHPGDVIEYQAYTNKLALRVAILNGSTLPDLSTVSGFDLQWDGTNVYFDMPTGFPALFGHMFYFYMTFDGGSYEQSGQFEPLTPGIATCQYPYVSQEEMTRLQVSADGTRVILLDLTEADYLAYDGNLYVVTMYAVGDAYGCITRRKDTQRNISVPFDFRGRKYRRYEIEAAGWIKNSAFSLTLPLSISATDGIYYGITPTPLVTTGSYATFDVRVTSGGTSVEVRLANFGVNYSIGDTLLIPGNLIGGDLGSDDIIITINDIGQIFGYYGITDIPQISSIARQSTGNYVDLYCFGNDGRDCYDIEWKGKGGLGTVFANYTGRCDNNVFLGNVYSIEFGEYIYDNSFNSVTTTRIGDYSQRNILSGQSVDYNEIGPFFVGNVILGQFGNNQIGRDFTGNDIYQGFFSNKIGNSFSNNKIGQSFSNNQILNSFSSNVIVQNFLGNTIDSNFSLNSIGDSFYYNKISTGFLFNKSFSVVQSNQIGRDFQSNSVYSMQERNIIGSFFQNNQINGDFSLNMIGSSFNSNVTENQAFKRNTVCPGIFAISFIGSTFVYSNDECTILNTSGGPVLTYHDGGGYVTAPSIIS